MQSEIQFGHKRRLMKRHSDSDRKESPLQSRKRVGRSTKALHSQLQYSSAQILGLKPKLIHGGLQSGWLTHLFNRCVLTQAAAWMTENTLMSGSQTWNGLHVVWFNFSEMSEQMKSAKVDQWLAGAEMSHKGAEGNIRVAGFKPSMKCSKQMYRWILHTNIQKLQRYLNGRGDILSSQIISKAIKSMGWVHSYRRLAGQLMKCWNQRAHLSESPGGDGSWRYLKQIRKTRLMQRGFETIRHSSEVPR